MVILDRTGTRAGLRPGVWLWSLHCLRVLVEGSRMYRIGFGRWKCRFMEGLADGTTSEPDPNITIEFRGGPPCARRLAGPMSLISGPKQLPVFQVYNLSYRNFSRALRPSTIRISAAGRASFNNHKASRRPCRPPSAAAPNLYDAYMPT